MKRIVNLDTNDKLEQFVNVMNTFDCAIDLVKGSNRVDAKSILGVVALGVYEPVEAEIITADEDELVRFSKEIESFR